MDGDGSLPDHPVLAQVDRRQRGRLGPSIPPDLSNLQPGLLAYF